MAIKRNEVVASIHAGIRSASDMYRKWSLGWTLAQSGVEALMVVEICRRLAGKLAKAESLLLEVPYPDLIEWSGVNTVGRKPATLKGRQRADIVLFNGRGRPTYAIEVKRCLNTRAGMAQDLGRLRDAVAKCSNQKGGTLKRGFFAAYHEGRVASVERWVEDFDQAYSGRKVSVDQLPTDRWRVGDDNASSIVLEIKAVKT